MWFARSLVIHVFIWQCCLLRSSVKADIALTMYTDLIQKIGQNSSCTSQESTNQTDKHRITNTSTNSLLLSQFSFKEISVAKSNTTKCDSVDVTKQAFNQYNWTCFATAPGSDLSRDTNWVFVDCIRLRLLSVNCLNEDAVSNMIRLLCEGQTLTPDCHTFSSDNERENVCSNKFRIERVIHKMNEDKVTFTSPLDIIAYVCICFILVVFLLSMCIPEERCRPTYSYDKNVAPRVPLSVYEMYDVNYQPSANKKLTKNMSVEDIAEPTTHTATIAVVQNSSPNINETANVKAPANNAPLNGTQVARTECAKRNTKEVCFIDNFNEYDTNTKHEVDDFQAAQTIENDTAILSADTLKPDETEYPLNNLLAYSRSSDMNVSSRISNISTVIEIDKVNMLNVIQNHSHPQATCATRSSPDETISETKQHTDASQKPEEITNGNNHIPVNYPNIYEEIATTKLKQGRRASRC